MNRPYDRAGLYLTFYSAGRMHEYEIIRYN